MPGSPNAEAMAHFAIQAARQDEELDPFGLVGPVGWGERDEANKLCVVRETLLRTAQGSFRVVECVRRTRSSLVGLDSVGYAWKC